MATIEGPEDALQLIERLRSRAGGIEQMPREELILGPPARISIPPYARRRAGIPEAAVSYCFAYPMQHVDGATASHLINELVGSVLAPPSHRLEPYLMFFVLGGFCYFDESDQLVRVNGLTFAPGGSHLLYFDGPFAAPEGTLAAMRALGRMEEVSLHQLLAAGVPSFGCPSRGLDPPASGPPRLACCI